MSQAQDPWRYRCPHGHSSWKSRQSNRVESRGEYYCIMCNRKGNDPHFDELRDMKHG